MFRRRIDWKANLLGLVALGTVFTTFAVFPTSETEALEEAVFDQYQRWKPRPYQKEDPDNPGQLLPPPPVLVIDIDEQSLEEMGQWPWPRYYLGEMIWRLSEAGAATIAFDVLFSEPDRTSPAQQAVAYGRFGEIYAGAVDAFDTINQQVSIDHDAIFSDAIAKNPVVLSMVGTNTPRDDRLPPQPKGIPISGPPLELSDVIEHYQGAITNLPVLSSGAQGIGAISLAQDATTMVRSVPLIVGIGDNKWPYPSLSIEALRVAQSAQSHVVKTSKGSGETDFSDQPVIVSMKTGGAEVPLTETGYLRIRYSEIADERVVSARDLLQPGGLSPETAERVAGKIIFVGSSAAGLFDIRQTPLHERIAGVHIHAEIVEQIWQQDFLERPDIVAGIERIVMVVCGLIVVWLVGNTMPLLGFVALVVFTGAIFGGSWWAFSEHSTLISPVGPALAVAIPHFVVSGYKYFVAENNRKEVTRQFEHFVAPEVIQDIVDDPERYLTPGGAQRELSIMFLDVRRFSTITEKMNPQEVIAFINKLLTPLTDVIIENEGTIDKYMGDAVMAFWNAPRETENHEMKAARAILAFNPIMEELNHEFAAMGLPDIDIGSGINTGECSVGNMGSLKRLAYSCVGDAVNLAARLEGQTKAYGVKNLIGSATAAGLKGFAAIEIDSVAVKGRTQPETIFTLAGDEEIAALPEYEMVAGAIAGARFAYLEQLWDAAEEAFKEVAKLPKVGCFEPEPFAEAFLARIGEYRENPPGEDWDGVYVATTK